MIFSFNETRTAQDAFQFGGELSITAENTQEVSKMIEHFKLFSDSSDPAQLRARIDALESSILTHVMQSDKRPMYEVDSCLDYEFSAPYKEWMRQCLGYDGTLPDIDIPRRWMGLNFTRYEANLRLECEHICFLAYAASKPWNGMDAQTYAEKSVKDYIAESFGTRHREPEMVPLRNGQYKRNPDYLKRHAATPLASNARLKRALFEWWIKNHASDAQKAIVQGNAEIARGAKYMGAFEFERQESVIYYAKTGRDYKSIRFAEFAALT